MAKKKTAGKDAKKAPVKAVATKKVAAPVKKAAPKPAPKPVAKKTVPAKKAVAAPKKAAPAKKQAPAKPAPKPVAVKKAAPVKAAPVKVVPKPAAKAAAKVVAAKPVAKSASKPVAVVKKAQEKPAEVIKPIAKSVVKEKPVVKTDIKSTPAKTETMAKKSLPEIKAEVKKEIKKEAAKPAAKVPIPKTSTDVSVKYEPDFTKSILDGPATPEYTGPTMRYSDNELVEFREIIMKKLEAAKKELAYLQGLITRKDEMGGDDTDNRYMTMEDGSMSMEREQLSQMASRQITFIDHLEKAIMRIENKTYGICRVTGKLIDKARLRAVPHATLSIEAKQGMHK
jgi:RNA polymerase-binding transcription factor DksA